MNEEMTWQRIAHRDPYLAGSIAARERGDETVEQSADGVGLSGEAKEKFLAGWREALTQAAEEAADKLKREQDALEAESLKGDPANY